MVDNINSSLNHLGTIELKTDRLILRKFIENDINDVYNNLLTDKKIIDFLSLNFGSKIDDTSEMIYNILKEYENIKGTYKWIIQKITNSEIIGIIIVNNYDELRKLAEVEYCISEDNRGKGYATEALKRCIAFLINDVGFFRIEGVCNTDNVNSGYVMEKSGMKFEGVMRGKALNLDKNGYPGDLRMYGITKTDL